MPQFQRLSARERGELDKQDAVLLTRPINDDPRVLAAFTRKMVRLMRGTRSLSPSADVVAFIAGVFEGSVAALTPQPAKAAIACRAGCAYCCAQAVVVTPMEVFALATLVRAKENTVAAVLATAEKMRGRDTHGAWVRCPLLADNACSVYGLRPLSCHSFVSLAVQDCIATYVMQGKPSVRTPNAYVDAMNACRTVMVAALKVLGRPSWLYELNAALAVALATEDSETRWLQGEEIFAGLEPMPIVAIWDAKIAGFADNVARTL